MSVGRERRSRRSRVGLLLCAVLMLPAARLAAQQKQEQKPDSLKTRAELIMDRLRAARPLIADTTAPDSATLDSLRADSIQRTTGRAPPRTSTMQRDSIMSELARLPGFAMTEYKADSARFAVDSSRLDLKNKSEVLRDGQLVVADSGIVFDQTTSIACARGKPTVSGGGMDTPIEADSLCFNADTRRGIAYHMKTEMTQGVAWIVHSDESFTVGDTIYSHSGWFTDCNLEEPHYHFAAGELKFIGGDIIVARNVTFNFRDVPVFWLPFFVQSTKQGRRSGILTPQFGVNDIFRQDKGYQRQISNIGVYLALSDHFGFETAVDWRSGDFTSLRGTMDYRYTRQFLAGSITYRNYWRAEGGRDFTLATRSEWQPDERTRLNGDVSYATSTRFIRTRSIDPRELNQAIHSSVGASRRFNWGSLNLSGTRDQRISDNTVTMTLPSLSLTLPSVTLFSALPGDAKWYNNATWNGSLSSNRQIRSVSNDNPSASARGNTQLTTNLSSSFTLGKFGISQGVQYTDVTDASRSFPLDTTLMDLPERNLRRMTWNTGINYQQRLIGNTTLTPGLTMRGELVSGDTTGGERVAAPTRIDFNASLRTDLFGFYPGVFGMERIRHRLSPSINFSYSPEPTVTDRQREVFGAINVREQNRISIGLSQTWEGKPKAKADTTAAADSAALAAQAARDTSSGPRRRQRLQPIQLLSINTDAIVYDFVQAKDGFGLQTVEIGNNIQSDLLRGLQFSFAHNLFRMLPADSVTGKPRRQFAPQLSRVSAAFSLNSDSWIARAIGLGRRKPEQRQPQGGAQQLIEGSPQDTGRVAPDIRDTGQQFGLLGAGRDRSTPRMDSGNWTASLNYTLTRPRDDQGGGINNQMLTANLSLQPTQEWAVNWSTGYNFTQGRFTDHILTLTRQMHDWDANFDFVKAQNGNFSFQFRVKLRANPDIKLDYQQRDIANYNQPIR
jgi:LptD protein